MLSNDPMKVKKKKKKKKTYTHTHEVVSLPCFLYISFSFFFFFLFFSKVPDSLRILCESCWDADKTKRPTFVELLSLFPNVLVDCAIFDERGRKFWKQHFVDAEEGLIRKVR